MKNYKEIHWVILGDGRKSDWVKAKSHELDLDDNFHLLGRFPIESMPSFFSRADIMLLSLKNEEIFSNTIPAKLQAYFAHKKPVLALIKGIAADIINVSGSGFVCNPDDAKDIASSVISAYNLPKNDLIKMGNNAYKYYLNHFERSMLFDSLEKRFIRLVLKPQKENISKSCHC